MKERVLWDNPEKDGSARYLEHLEQRKKLGKKSRKEDWGRKKRLENFGDSTSQ
jgi:hypothetical protein